MMQIIHQNTGPKGTPYVVAAVLIILGASILTTKIALQVSLLGSLVVLACTTGSMSRMLLVSAVFVPILAFIRRVSAGPAARVDFDPLILLPFLLVLIVIVAGCCRRLPIITEARQVLNRRVIVGALVFFFGVTVSIVLNGSIRPEVIYFATALVLPITLAAVIATGAVPDVWNVYERALPFIGLLVGAYGLLQFVLLPEWDRNWMISSELQSIGQPFPFGVRVFGMSESPGPYAAFLGLAIIVCIDKALSSGGSAQAGWFLIGGMLVIPLLLSGVRSALLSLFVCVAIATIMRGRGLGRVIPVLFVFIVGAGIDRLVGAFGANSTILTADRYTTFDPQQDDSFQARLGLIHYLTNPWPHMLGNPTAPPVDNLPIDILRAYGFIPFMFFTIMLLVVFRFSWRLLSKRESSSVGLCALYVLILGISGNLFLSSFGILIGIIFGACLKRVLDVNYATALGSSDARVCP